jgi:hypothetical protein
MATRIMRRIKRKCVQIGVIEPQSATTCGDCGAAEEAWRGENIARVPSASSGYDKPLSSPRGGRRATNCDVGRAAGLKSIAACTTRRARETRCREADLSGHHRVRTTCSSRHPTSAGTESKMVESASEDLRSAKKPVSKRYHFFSRKNLIPMCNFKSFANKSLQLTEL